MIPPALFDRRPIVVAVAGPNGAGKTTFYNAFLRQSGLRLVNADALASALGLGAYEAAAVAESIRREMLNRHESFAFETVFSDPVGDKIAFLKQAGLTGYSVVLFFIGNSSPKVSRQRVAMRVAQGGHNVPAQKLVERYPRIMANLAAALRELPEVWVYDNDVLSDPFRLVAVTEGGSLTKLNRPIPKWLRPHLPPPNTSSVN
jgi:predicted ABC-type ATPase